MRRVRPSQPATAGVLLQSQSCRPFHVSIGLLRKRSTSDEPAPTNTQKRKASPTAASTAPGSKKASRKTPKGRDAVKKLSETSKGGGDDFDMDRLMETLLKATTGKTAEEVYGAPLLGGAGSQKGTANDAETVGILQLMMPRDARDAEGDRDLEMVNSRTSTGAQMLQCIPTVTTSGDHVDLPDRLRELVSASTGRVSLGSCIPVQVVSPRITLAAQQKTKRSATATQPPQCFHVVPTNVMPTLEGYSPLVSADGVTKEAHSVATSSPPMEFFDEPCYQGYLQRYLYPHLNRVSTERTKKKNGSPKSDNASVMERNRELAEIVSTLHRNSFPFNKRPTTPPASKAAPDVASANDRSIVAPFAPGSTPLLSSAMIHATVDWSLPVFHRLQNNILFNDHLKGGSQHIHRSTLSEEFLSEGFCAKEADVLETALLRLVEVAKEVWPERASAKRPFDRVPSELMAACYEYALRLYYGTVAPARYDTCNNEFVDPHAQLRRRLLSPMEATRLLVEPQGEPESALDELDEVLGKYHRHRSPDSGSTSFTLVRERVIVEPESDITSIDDAIAHVRRLAEINEKADSKRSLDVKDSPPPTEERGTDGKLTPEYLARYTKWFEEKTRSKDLEMEERAKLLQDPKAIEAMRETLVSRELEHLREKTRVLRERSKRQHAQLRAIYKMSPSEVLEKYGTLVPVGSMPVVLRKYSLSILQDRTMPTSSSPPPGAAPLATAAAAKSSTDQADLHNESEHAPPVTRTRTTREGIYSFFYSTQPEMEAADKSSFHAQEEAHVLDLIFKGVLAVVQEAVGIHRGGERNWFPWSARDSATTSTTASTTTSTTGASLQEGVEIRSDAGPRGYGDVPYLSPLEVDRAETKALPNLGVRPPKDSMLATRPALNHLCVRLSEASHQGRHLAHYKMTSHAFKNDASQHDSLLSTIVKKDVPVMDLSHQKSIKEVVRRLRCEEWQAVRGKLVSKDGDTIEQPPVGRHQVYLTFCVSQNYSKNGKEIIDGVCTTVSDSYCHGAQHAISPEAPTAVTSAGGVAEKVWTPEHCTLDKEIAKDYRDGKPFIDAMRPLPPSFRE